MPTTPFAIIAISWTRGGVHEHIQPIGRPVSTHQPHLTSFNHIDPPIDEIVTNSGSKKLGAHLLVLNLMHGTFFAIFSHQSECGMPSAQNSESIIVINYASLL